MVLDLYDLLSVKGQACLLDKMQWLGGIKSSTNSKPLCFVSFFSQLQKIESKASSSEKLVKDLQERNENLSYTVTNLEEQRRNAAKQNWKLLNQKMQLQRLIERLTKLQT